ncbi:fasciclin domain-containing protein [Bacteroidia bacterium]|nr:fasciclin domain-containing protein [Bacteroidia bacterium]MDB4107073.1 fasciclin domain-containing protein [Bacteroidia bacterium]MDB9882623.1 fasciclin domain-containing protein [Bacteroidia bacterium]MDC1395109.1 fasciclin domain-containing protein [Bacteroidia bacterium]
MTKSISIYALLIAVSFFFVGCSDESDDETTPTPTSTSNTIADIAKGDDFTTLAAALDRADLISTLEGEGPFTVFAPTNEAFDALLTELKIDGLDKVTDDQLTQILLNHVISGKVTSADLEAGYVSTLANGPKETKVSLLVDLTSGVLLNNRANVITPNVDADNGVVHVIDKVLLVPNVVDAAVANPSFSILVQALTDKRLNADFVEILSGEGPFTVFAPTDDAFVALLGSNEEWNGLADIPVGTLEAVLKYHVIAGSNITSSEITDGSEQTTFEGSIIKFNTANGVVITDKGGRESSVALANVQTSNGVIHAINSVILPLE